MNRMSGNRDRRLPLTAAQTGMWFSQQLHAENPIYRAAEYVDIHGRVDPALLEAALRRAVAETETLRVRFETDDEGRAWQVVETPPDWPLPVTDLRGAANPWEEARTWMREELRRPLDAGRPPLFTFRMLRLADDRVVLYLSFHHIVLDGYGFSLFIQRVTELYGALEAGRPCPPSPLGTLEPLLADEARYRASERFTEDRAYWTEQLAGRPRAEGPAGRWTTLPYTFVRETGYVAAPVADGLRTLARQARSGLPAAAMAAMALYIHRMSGNPEVSLHLTVSGRCGAVARGVPTMLANILPLHLRTSPWTTVGDLVRHTARQARALLRHQRYASYYLVHDLGIADTGGYLADWGINIMGYDPELRFGDHPATLHNLSNGPVTGLSANVYDRTTDGTLRIDFNADPDRYDAATTAAHHRRFLRLLETLADGGPDRPIAAIDLLPDEERRRVVNGWNDTARPVPGTSLPELFAAQARRTPHARALVCGDRELTYAALDARADRLARLLTRRGAGPETFVALALPRSADHVVALLAVLKAGAAAVPVDLRQPPERVAFLLADADPLCVLTTTAGASALPRPADALLLDDPATVRALEDDPATVRALEDEPGADDPGKPAPPRPEHPAYVSYTSGSTGRPKGVVVEHRQLSNLYFDHRDTLIGPESAAAGRRLRAALTAAFSFDTAWEGPLFLTAGHELHLVEEAVRLDPPALVRYVTDHRIDFLDLTPSYLHQLAAEGLFDDAGHRPRVLMVGGEAVDAALWRTLRELPGTRAYNYYGPTECTVDAVYCRIGEHGDHPVIGRPGHNVRAYVLDAALHPVPATVPGELYLAGEQVARGYLGLPALTAERFVADPFGAPGTRMYRTGDRARWTEDGVLEYLGRTDTQVKLRGHRIEPGEIEAVLTRHQGVARAAVVVREDTPGDRRLTAYVVPSDGGADGTTQAEGTAAEGTARADGGTVRADGGTIGAGGARAAGAERAVVPGQRPGRTSGRGGPAGGADTAAVPLDPADLRAWATERLPAYMVPAAYVTLDALPLTRHGKLDRAALPAPAAHPRGGGGRPPRGPREEALCGLFAEVLGERRVNADDDFFALGGHSLLAAKLIGRIRSALGTDLSIRALFEAPTVAALARKLGAGDARPAEPDAFEVLLPLRADGTRPPLFCVHPAGGLSWCYAGLLRHLGADLPVYGIQARGLAGPGGLPGTFAEMVDDYVAHIRKVQPAGPYHLLGWSLGGALAHAVAVRLQEEGARVDLLAMLDSRPIDPAGTHGALPEQQDVMTLLLEAAGHGTEGSGSGRPLGVAEVAAILSEDSHTQTLLTPMKDHPELGERHVAAVTEVVTNSVNLLRTFTGGVFEGDLLYFHATEDKPAHAPGSGAWRPWVTGRIESHDVPCAHHAMTQSEPLAHIGRALADHLATVDVR
ncbi:amino acid adenylation domain-containing protein [Streptomyces sp. NPDC003077]|uniref:amino acid adenylation domain-containing protein n=1 Tax=Streptomyces sp. NPDC003077 TaxID=3154443 RepID=UPI0033BAE1D9